MLVNLFIRYVTRRPPDLIIGTPDNPYMLRWHLIRWRGWQLALHRFMRDDDDRAPHDHVGDNLTLIVSGPGYVEHLHDRHERKAVQHRRPWRLYFRRAEDPHRITLYVNSAPTWTLWLRWPARREWGFYCPQGWRHWKIFCDTGARENDSHITGVSAVGRGCDD